MFYMVLNTSLILKNSGTFITELRHSYTPNLRLMIFFTQLPANLDVIFWQFIVFQCKFESSQVKRDL